MEYRRMSWGVLAPALALAALGVTPSLAQVRYPNGPVKMVVGFAAGSATDVVARVVSAKLQQRLGEPIVVENKTGAGGYIASEAVVRAKPDGQTLLAVASAIATNPAVMPKMTFDTERDLTPITLIGRVPTVVSVSSKLPVENLQAFIAYARANPGKVNFGSSGKGGSTHLAAELFGSVSSVKMNHVPYRGNAPALTALMSGEIDMLIDNILGAVSSAKNPRVRILAISSDSRSDLLPGVPTFQEAGLPAYKAAIFFGIMGPAGMPPAVVERLHREISEVLKDKDVERQLQQNGLVISGAGPAEFAAVLHEEIAQWTRVARQAGISPDSN